MNKASIVLFLVDGMRPDGLLQAHTPTIDRLVQQGVSTMKGRTVMPSGTLPCHTSLFHSVPPERHGIVTNTYIPPVRPVPGLIETIHQAGGVTASFYNWEELRDIARPDSLNASFYLKNNAVANGLGDLEIAVLAANWLGRSSFSFAFVYFGYTDMTGHSHGWMSPEYLRAIANADRCIEMVTAALPQDATVIVTADHGGHEFTHGTEMAEDMTVPFVLSGNKIPSNRTISRSWNIIDIAPTVLSMLDLSLPAAWMGRQLDIENDLA